MKSVLLSKKTMPFDPENTAVTSFKTAFYQLNKKPDAGIPARRDFYKIWLILNECELTLDNETIHITAPAIVFLHPLVTYKLHPIAIKRSGYWCIFNAEFLNALHKEKRGPDATLFQTRGQVFLLNKTSLHPIQFYFQQLVTEFGSDYPGRYDSCRHLVELIMHEGRKLEPAIRHSKQQNAANRLMNRFFNLLEMQYPIASTSEVLKLRKPADFAGELAVHINHLNAVIQETTGKSTRQIIADRLLSESKALLYYTDWSVADIAYSLGFEYPNHFTTFFKKNTGQTPLSLRK